MKKLVQWLFIVFAATHFLSSCEKEDEAKNVEIPTLSTLAVTEITASEAQSGGQITDDGGAAVTARGIVWSTESNPVIEQHAGKTNDGSGTGMYTSLLSGLEASTSYFVRAYATNSSGTAYGNALQFTTEAIAEPPVAAFSATPLEGTAPLTVSFTDQSTNNPTSLEWDFGDGHGSTEQNPEHIYQEGGNYTVSLAVYNSGGSDIEIKSNYIHVVSPGGSGCGGITEFNYAGQTYNTVEIGDQCWMKENLNREMGNSWCYDNDPANCVTYGRLYDWETAMSACPVGWHLPSDEEWKILEGTVDSYYGVGDAEWDRRFGRGLDAGSNLKSTYGWYNDGNGYDDYGFEALPGGWVYNNNFDGVERYAIYWSSTEDSQSDSWSRKLEHNSRKSWRTQPLKENGFSVRCLKN